VDGVFPACAGRCVDRDNLCALAPRTLLASCGGICIALWLRGSLPCGSSSSVGRPCSSNITQPQKHQRCGSCAAARRADMRQQRRLVGGTTAKTDGSACAPTACCVLPLPAHVSCTPVLRCERAAGPAGGCAAGAAARARLAGTCRAPTGAHAATEAAAPPAAAAAAATGAAVCRLDAPPPGARRSSRRRHRRTRAPPQPAARQPPQTQRERRDGAGAASCTAERWAAQQAQLRVAGSPQRGAEQGGQALACAGACADAALHCVALRAGWPHPNHLMGA
jgi:hypothetical protein